MKTLTLEGNLTTVDTRTQLTTQGSVTSPSLVTPSDTTKITGLVFAAAADGLAVGSSSYILRIAGNAIKNGEQVIVIGASGTIAVQAGSDAAPQVGKPMYIGDLDIECGASDTVSIAAEMVGSDNGTARVCVTLIFA